MFAYLIIALELAILYSFYWFVFVREPQPIKIAGNLWGTYDYKGDDLSTYEDWSFITSRYITDEERQAMVNVQKGIVCIPNKLPMKPIGNTTQYGWVAKQEVAMADPADVTRLLSKFRDSVEVRSLNVH
jgi:hypothetical protein